MGCAVTPKPESCRSRGVSVPSFSADQVMNDLLEDEDEGEEEEL